MPDRDAGGELVERILSSLCPGAGDELEIGGIGVSRLVAEFGSPLYVHDADLMRRRLGAVQSAFGARVDILYSIKANPLLATLQVFAQGAAGAEVASAGELLAARRAGFPAASLQFAGPGKNREDLLQALEEGIDAINLESQSEYEFLCSLSKERGKRARVALRVNPGQGSAGSRLSMRGAGSKFGIEAEQAKQLLKRILDQDQLDFVGLHCYSGTQCFDAGAWLEEASFLRSLAGELEAACGTEIQSLNFGGGFGVPYSAGDPEFELDTAATGLRDLIAKDARPSRRYRIELGRYLVAPFAVYLAKVLYRKTSGGREFAILDGGLHHHSAAAGMGSVLRRPYPVVVANKLFAEATQEYCLAGPLCTSVDSFHDRARLPKLEEGDLIAVLQSGAYGLSFSNSGFLSHPSPAEVIVVGGEARLARERSTPADFLKGQKLLEPGPSCA